MVKVTILSEDFDKDWHNICSFVKCSSQSLGRDSFLYHCWYDKQTKEFKSQTWCLTLEEIKKLKEAL